MTKPIQLKIGDRVQFWATWPYGKPYGKGFWTSKRLKRETDRMVPGTVVSVDPLRVLWDFTAVDKDGNNGPPMEYPLGNKHIEGYDRSCIRKLPPYAQRRCENCLYGQTEEYICPEDEPSSCSYYYPEPGGKMPLHKWRPIE